MPQVTFRTPGRFAVSGAVLKNPILQLAANERQETFELFRRRDGRIDFTVLRRQDNSEIALVARSAHATQGANEWRRIPLQ